MRLDKLLVSRATVLNNIKNRVGVGKRSPSVDEQLAATFMVEELVRKAELFLIAGPYFL